MEAPTSDLGIRNGVPRELVFELRPEECWGFAGPQDGKESARYRCGGKSLPIVQGQSWKGAHEE